MPTEVLHTLEEIDFHLSNISNVIKYGKKVNKEGAMRMADKWLDLRNDLTKGGENGTQGD